MLNYLFVTIYDLFKKVRDTSSNDILSTMTRRRKFLSNYQFVDKSLRRIHLRRIQHLLANNEKLSLLMPG